jgi:hypothetical protein
LQSAAASPSSSGNSLEHNPTLRHRQYEKDNSEAPVNKQKVCYSMVWYAGSLVGYAAMERNSQGLHLKTSQEMFLFTASETLFMVSMALCYFYTWQTYTLND